MKVVSTFHPSSSVISSVKCRLATRDLEHLVVAKLNRIDVYSLRAHGLEHECGLDILGKICSVKAIRLSDYETRSNIALMITHPEPELIILGYSQNEGAGELIVKKTVSLFERLPRIAEFCTDVFVHPSGRLAVVSAYAGKLKIVTFKGGAYEEDFDVSIPELNIMSLSFLPTQDGEYALGILHIDSQERLQLCARDIDIDSLELSYQFSTILPPTIIPEKCAPYPTDFSLQLIPVPPELFEDDSEIPETAFIGGIAVAGGKQILLYELASKESQEKQRGKQKRLENKKKGKDVAEIAKAKAKEIERNNRKRKAKASVEWPWSTLSVWGAIDGAPSRFLVGDSFGRLSLLSFDNINELGIILIPLGQTSSATTITYLTNQTVYLGSHLGDSQLLKISESAVSSEDLPALALPVGINTSSAGSLSAVSSKKGKEKASEQDADMDIEEDESTESYIKGRVVDSRKSFITVLENYKNIAPILDAILVDTDGNKENQIVTCSGGANTGSINVIRNGADFKEMASIPGITNVTGVWSVKSSPEQLHDTHMVLSMFNESHFFQINDVGGTTTLKRVENASTGGFITSQQTLAFGPFCKRENSTYTPSNLVVQVIPTGAFLLEWDASLSMYIERASWMVTSIEPPTSRHSEVVAASINNSQVALALSGGRLVLLCIDNGILQLRQLTTHSTRSEISAISFQPLDTRRNFSNVLGVAYWSSNVVELLALREGALHSEGAARSPPLPAVVRSILLHNFGNDASSKGQDYHPYLMAGLGDGSVAHLHWKDGALKDLKIISLGNTPVTLIPCEVDGKKCVFAASNKSSVFHLDKNRLANSSITLKEISAVSRLNTRSFQSALILAAPNGLFIGSVGNLKKMHIRSSSFGLDNPRRITHSSDLKAFGVACTRAEPGRIGEYDVLTSSFHLVDDTTLARLGKYECEENEEITSAISFTSTLNNEEKTFFCLGTMIFKPEEKEPSLGRLLIFTAHSSSAMSRETVLELALLTSVEVKGCVYALRNVNDRIVAAVNSSIMLFELGSSSVDGHKIPTLQKLSEWNHNYLVTSLGSIDNQVVAGDQISSVSLLKMEKNALVSKARDYGPLYPIAVEAINERDIIASNDTLNLVLFTLTKNLRGEVLETVGSYHVADMVSKFVRGSLSTGDNTQESKFQPELVFFTSSGKIGVITDVLDKELALHLTEVQRNLAATISGVGGVSHTRFRAPKSTRGTSDADGSAYGFVDGDFLEQFLNIQSSEEALGKVMKGGSAPEALKISAEEISKVLEQLQSLH